jgi:hypothetical protein
LYFELVHMSFVWDKFPIGQIIFSRRNSRFAGQYRSTSALLHSFLFSEINLLEQPDGTCVPRNKAVRLRKLESIRLKSGVIILIVQCVKSPVIFGEVQNYILSSFSFFFLSCVCYF